MALTKVSNSMLVQPVNHNILINPAFTVKQRGDVIDHVDSNSVFGPDRWGFRELVAVGGTMSQSTTVVDPITGINKLLVKHRNSKSFAYTFQNIEAVNLQGLYSKEITFSFSYSEAGGSGIPKVDVVSYDSSATHKYLYTAIPTSLGDNRWTCTFTLSTADGTIPDPNETGMQVAIFPNEKNNAPSEWYLWETKLEAGSVATPFIARQYGEELALCQRYFRKFGSDGIEGYIPASGMGAAQDDYRIRVNYLLSPEMRVTPSLSQYALEVNNLTMDDSNPVTGVSFAGQEFSASAVSLFFRTATVSGQIAGQAAFARVANSDNGYLYMEAEL